MMSPGVAQILGYTVAAILLGLGVIGIIFLVAYAYYYVKDRLRGE